MSSIYDLIASTMLFGILALNVAGIQLNMLATMYQNHFSLTSQTSAVSLAEQIEYDFAKIGYRASGEKILFADSNAIRFSSDLDRTGVSVVVDYSLGTADQIPQTANSADIPLFRQVGADVIRQHFGLTQFRLSYYDSAFQAIQTPIAGLADRLRIRSIKVEFIVEAPEPVSSAYDTTWAEVAWEKMIFPKNIP